MLTRGINYDTGFVNGNAITRESFEIEVVRSELRIIRNNLHCTAVRVTGGIPDRLEAAASAAADAGLEVWFCPFTCDLTAQELLDLLGDCADRAERLRRSGADVVFLTGSELSLATRGFLPGNTLPERVAALATPGRFREHLEAVPGRVNDFLARAVDLSRNRFGGQISYASLPLERVDWSPFDIISTDAAYRSTETAAVYRNSIRTFVNEGVRQRKPVAITEFGCTTHRGAARLGGRGDLIVERDDHGTPIRLDDDYVRDEQEQAKYIEELLDVFAAEGVDAAFVNTFARYDLPHRSEPRNDFDMASYGIVKVLEGRKGSTYLGMPWEPKAAFDALAGRYGS